MQIEPNQFKLARSKADWPIVVEQAFHAFDKVCAQHNISLLAIATMTYFGPGPPQEGEEAKIEVMMSPHSSQNSHVDEMCDDIAKIFKLMAKRMRQ